MRRPLGSWIVWVILYRPGLAVDSHESRVPGNPNITGGILSKAVPSELRPCDWVVRPSGRARVHLAYLQAPRIHVPNVSIVTEGRIVESALAVRDRRSVVFGE